MKELLEELAKVAPELCQFVGAEMGTGEYLIGNRALIEPLLPEGAPATLAVAAIRDWIFLKVPLACIQTWHSRIGHQWNICGDANLPSEYHVCDYDNGDELNVAVRCALAVAKEIGNANQS